jgi:hypothetical protein
MKDPHFLEDFFSATYEKIAIFFSLFFSLSSTSAQAPSVIIQSTSMLTNTFLVKFRLKNVASKLSRIGRFT